MFGVRRGFHGLIEGDVASLDNRAVGGIIERGGTMLLSARSEAFRTEEGQARALEVIRRHELDGIIVIGGNGSLRGARWLSEQNVLSVGIPASIDNDIPQTAMAIGVDTALNTVVECMNRLRDTAIAHGRAFVIEVMGRLSGYIAVMAGLAGGAEVVLVPEIPVPLASVVKQVRDGVGKGKHHSVIVVAEGFRPAGRPSERISAGRMITDVLSEEKTIETRLTILGHLQRGGSPSAFDRILACRFAEAAISWISSGRGGVYTGLADQAIAPVSFEGLDDTCRNVDPALLELVRILAH